MLFTLTDKIFYGAANASKPSNNTKIAKDKPVNGVQPSKSVTDVGKLVEDLLDKTSALLLSEVRKILCFSPFSTLEVLC